VAVAPPSKTQAMLGVLHHGKGLPFGLEAGHDLAGVHAQLDDFERDPPPHRFLLFGHPHDAETALADLLQQLVMADAGAGLFRQNGWQLRQSALAGSLEQRGAAPHGGLQ
jgi:hypothetical protein